MIAAIEVYNKPDFLYRGETFSILAINSWELLLKAKHLKDNHNKMRSLYVMEPVINKDGSKSKKKKVKLTRSGNPFTHSIDFIAKKLIEKGEMDQIVFNNIMALIELRDSAIKHTLVQKPLTRENLDDFVDCYCSGHMQDRVPTYSVDNPNGRWRKFSKEEVYARDQLKLDFKWIVSEEDDDRTLAEMIAQIKEEATSIASAVAELEKLIGEVEE